MRDINTPLLTAYFSALTGITYNSTPVPVYSGIVPDNINPNNYILFGEITNNDKSTKSNAETGSMIRVTIHTFDEKYVSPKIANEIADQVLQRIHPTTHFNLTLSGSFYMSATTLFSDTTEHMALDANRSYVDRRLVFRHIIYQR